MPRNLFYYQNLPQRPDQSLFFEGINLINLDQVKNYSEPFLIYKKSLIKERIQWLKSWPQLTQLHYAMKANYHPEILKIFLDQGCGLDVVSLGEIQAGFEIGFKPKDILFSGVGKTVAELEFAIEHEIFQINVESQSELKRIIQIAKNKNKKVAIGLRVNPEIEVSTHPYISTALKDSKFGIDLGELSEVLALIQTEPLIQFKCISFHIGSQILQTEVLNEALIKMKKLYLDLKKDFNLLNRLDLGGGLGIDYHHHDTNDDEQRWLNLKNNYSDILKDFKDEVYCEMGRFMVARSGIFISQVQYIKKENMLVLDLGMNNNLRPSLYQAHHHFYNMIKSSVALLKNYSIVGPICESSDVFHKKFNLYPVAEGDFLVKADCGAYVRSMASQYNLKNIAPEYFFD